MEVSDNRGLEGQSFLSDICELAPQMLPYSRKYFEELISTGRIREIVPSETWYEWRKENYGYYSYR